MDVLRGLEKTLLRENCRLVYVEVHQPTADKSPDITDFGSNPDEVPKFLEYLGFSTETIFERSRDFHIKARK
jgi:hypothetical protein